MYRTAEGTFDRIDEYFLRHGHVETEAEGKTAGIAGEETSQSNESKESKENEAKPDPIPSNSSSIPSNSPSSPRLLSYICIDQGNLCTLKYCSNCGIFVPPRAYHCRFCGVYLCFHVSQIGAFGTSIITAPGCRTAWGFATTNSFYGFS